MLNAYHKPLFEDLSKCVIRNDVHKRKHVSTSNKTHFNKVPRSRTEENTQSDAFIVEQKELPEKETDERAKRETFRLASFRKCKIAVPPYELAMAGFYYVGPGDRVRCFSCGNCVQSWKPKDNPSASRWHASDCGHCFKKDSNNISIGESASSNWTQNIVTTATSSTTTHSSSSSSSQSGQAIKYPSIDPPSYNSSQKYSIAMPLPTATTTLSSLIIKPGSSIIDTPVSRFGVIYSVAQKTLLKKLDLQKEADRRNSFTSQWPHDLLHLIEPLARTGFFYLGNSDRTQCFSCGAVQKNWLATDDVYTVHSEWFPHCRMVNDRESRNIPLSEQPDLSSASTQGRTSPSRLDFSLSSSTMQPTSASSESYLHTPPPPTILSSPMHSSTVLSSEILDSQIRGPPTRNSLERVDNSNLVRQSSEQSNNSSANSMLDFVFTTPAYTTESGDLTVSLPVHRSEFSNVTTSISNIVPTNKSVSNFHAIVTSPLLSNVAASSELALSACRSSPALSSLPVVPGHLSSSASSSQIGAALVSPPITQTTSRISPVPSLSPHSSSTVVNLAPASASSSVSVLTPMTSQDRLLQPTTLNPAVVTSPKMPSLLASATSQEASTSYPRPSRSSPQNWLRDLDPLSAVAGPSEEPTLPELPQTELNVDELLVEDKNMRFMLREMYPCREPVNRDMVYLSQRLSTFRHPWPENNAISSIPEVAKAGFYYLDVNDHVRCWYCNVEAKDWASEHDAWSIHARLYPTCQYLLRNRGLGFVESVLSQTTNEAESASTQPASSTFAASEIPPLETGFSTIESGPQRLPSPPTVDPRAEQEQKRLDFQDAMQSDLVRTVIQMGFTNNHVRQVVKRQIDQFSCFFQSTEALIEKLIMTPENLIDLNSDEEEENRQENQPSSSNQHAGLMEELPDSLDLYQSASETSNVSQPEEEQPATTSGRDGTSALYEFVISQINRNKEPDRSMAAKRDSPEPPTTSNLEEILERPEDMKAELLRLRHEKRCKVCLDRDANMVFLPCGHICACMQCAHRLKRCPLCRKYIDKAVKTY